MGQTLTYIPIPDFTGVDTFTYKASDGANESDVRTATITVYGAFHDVAQLVGVDIDGKAAGDKFGAALAISSDGKTIAIGAEGNDETGVDAGHVRIYQYEQGWQQLGSDIYRIFKLATCQVPLFRSRAMVEGLRSEHVRITFSKGQVRVYEFNEGIWTQVGL